MQQHGQETGTQPGTHSRSALFALTLGALGVV